jgi:hypothetical protein
MELVFVDPNTSRQAGVAGYEHRVEEFSPSAPVGNVTQLEDREYGSDPTLGKGVWG